jgi:hypothetical protein
MLRPETALAPAFSILERVAALVPAEVRPTCVNYKGRRAGPAVTRPRAGRAHRCRITRERAPTHIEPPRSVRHWIRAVWLPGVRTRVTKLKPWVPP